MKTFFPPLTVAGAAGLILMISYTFNAPNVHDNFLLLEAFVHKVLFVAGVCLVVALLRIIFSTDRYLRLNADKSLMNTIAALLFVLAVDPVMALHAGRGLPYVAAAQIVSATFAAFMIAAELTSHHSDSNRVAGNVGAATASLFLGGSLAVWFLVARLGWLPVSIPVIVGVATAIYFAKRKERRPSASVTSAHAN